MATVCTKCGAKAVARRLCRRHYNAARYAGTLDEHAKLEPQPGFECAADHAHGQSAVCYIHHKCRCTECRRARREQENRRRRLKAYGRYDRGLVEAEPIREHLLLLRDFGIGYRRAARQAGVGVTAVRTLIYGRMDPGPRLGEVPKHVKRETAEALLSVKPDLDTLADGARVPARGTHRRIQALVAIGWSLSKIGQRLDILPANMTSLLRRHHVTAGMHRKVAALFDELWSTLPPRETWHDSVAYSRSVRFAKDRRWLPPLAWDDIDNDIEPPVPDDVVGIDETAVELALAGERVRLTPEERRECVRRLHRERWSDGRVAETLGCSLRTVLRIRAELGLAAWDQNDLRDRGAA